MIATSGADALKLLRQEHPDLILLDVYMRIVQRHGGHVWLTGEIQKGAIFHFSLPK